MIPGNNKIIPLSTLCMRSYKASCDGEWASGNHAAWLYDRGGGYLLTRVGDMTTIVRSQPPRVPMMLKYVSKMLNGQCHLSGRPDGRMDTCDKRCTTSYAYVVTKFYISTSDA